MNINHLSLPKQNLVADAEANGYTATQNADGSILIKRRSRGVLILGNGRIHRHGIRFDLVKSMPLAQARSFLFA